MPGENRQVRNYNNIINESNLIEEFSRNNRNTIINALMDPEDVRSRNNFIPSFNVSSQEAKK